MKALKIIFVAGLLISINAFSQSSITQIESNENNTNVKGFRIFTTMENLSFNSITQSGDEIFDSQSEIDSTFGVGIGYAKIDFQKVGWTTNLTYLKTQQAGGRNSEVILRGDANIAYSYFENLVFKAGPNVIKLLDGDRKDFGMRIGYQMGAGYQFSKMFGVDVAYVEMQTTKTSDKANYSQEKWKLFGVDLSAHLTF